MSQQQQQQVFSDRYELVDHIARGGMAQVYLARDLLLDRPVALKVLFPELSVDQSFVERFRREAQAAAKLAHPNIVSIYDWGQGEHTYFIVMEYIDGYTLSSLIRQGPVDASRAASIGADVASALEFAHRHDVIHRDVKPGNVLIDKSGQVKVTDFGIARAIGTKEGLTQTGAVMGTATYFSPEQAQGFSVDARSDVYSLGVVLYEMVVGRPPFEGESPVAIAYKHVRETPVRPSVANPAVPRAFEKIIMQAMAKDVDERYQAADALRADLLRFHLGQGVLAREVAPTMVAHTDVLPRTRTGRDTTVLGNGRAAAAARDDERRSRTGLYAALLALLLAVLAALVFFLGRGLGWWAPAVKTLGVPTDLVGEQYPKAAAELQKDGFTDVVKAAAPSTDPAGRVLYTDPKGGTRMKSDARLLLTVSQGPAHLGTPDEVGRKESQALADLKSHDLKGQVVKQSSSKVPTGAVISQSPHPGVTTTQGSTVTLAVSTGPKKVSIPSLSGDDPVSAAGALQTLGLKPKQQNEPSSSYAAGTVIGTNPGAGNSVVVNSTVVVYVSSGPAQVTVPAVDGLTVAQADSALAGAGLSVAVAHTPVTSPSQNNIVQSANPAQGTSVNAGSTVTLFVGTYSAPSSTTSSTSSTTSTTKPTTTTSKPTTTTTPTTKPKPKPPPT